MHHIVRSRKKLSLLTFQVCLEIEDRLPGEVLWSHPQKQSLFCLGRNCLRDYGQVNGFIGIPWALSKCHTLLMNPASKSSCQSAPQLEKMSLCCEFWWILFIAFKAAGHSKIYMPNTCIAPPSGLRVGKWGPKASAACRALRSPKNPKALDQC